MSRVLLIEDNPLDIEYVRAALAMEAEFDLDVVGNLSAGMKTLEAEVFDAILLDLNLPDSSDLETLDRIRAVSGKTPILVLSSIGNEEVALSAVRSGAQDYLVKGVDRPDLLARSLRYAMGRNRLVQELEEAHRHEHHLATHDPLTGLANRQLFEDHLRMAIANARRTEQPLALVYIDLDGFKSINDKHGHPAGDFLLKVLGGHLAKAILESDLAARIGGDEFTLVYSHISNLQALMRILKVVTEMLSTPVRFGSLDLRVTPSLGVAVCPTDGRDAPTLMANADKAMYRAKKSGGNRFLFCDSALDDRSSDPTFQDPTRRRTSSRTN